MNFKTENFSRLLFTILAVIASITVKSQYSKLHDFAYGVNSAVPDENLIEVNGELYGTTYQGGVNDEGTIFKIQKDGTGYIKLFDFDVTATGRYPKGSLYFDGTYLYGTAWQGGSNNRGTVYKIMPDGTSFSVIFNFNNTNGRSPEGSLISDGTYLYGTASLAGANGNGSVFKMLFDGSGHQDIHDFSTSAKPLGTLLIVNSELFGVTSQNGLAGAGGEVFKMNTNGTGFATLHTFSSAMLANGVNPLGTLAFDGTYLFGATHSGGLNDEGTLFKILPDGTSFSTIFEFNSPFFGAYPYGELIVVGDYVYGMTSEGGSNTGGSLFKISKDGVSQNFLVEFDDTNSGKASRGGLFYDGGALYGMTRLGGLNNAGTIFKYCNIDMSLTVSGASISVGTSGATYQWIDCGTAQPIAGETNQSFTASSTGIYQVEVTINGCTDVSVCEPLCVVNNSVTQFNNELTADLAGVSYQWIDCNNGNVAIAGAINQTYTPISNGNYAVIVNNGSCSDTSSCFVIADVGFDESANTTITMFPNPTTNAINIISETDIQEIEIVDLQGKIVFKTRVNSKTVLNLDLSSFDSGLYSITIQDVNSNITVLKLVKND